MPFTSLLFFPLMVLLVGVNALIPARFRKYLLLGVSYGFAFYAGMNAVVWLLGSTLITFIFGSVIEKASSERRKKTALIISVIIVLAVLFFFKYLNFGIQIVQSLLQRLGLFYAFPYFSILQPLGISFYTFTELGYLIDVYRGKTRAEKNLCDYALFIAFFPKLIQGPIERKDHFLSQIQSRIRPSWMDLKAGMLRVFYGYYLKLVIADNAAVIVNSVWGTYPQADPAKVLTAAVLFSIQIYTDFYGYTLIAAGCAQMLGITLAENFRSPYMAVSVADFWRRWHISLTSWFRDYLYIPLGGNRKGKIRQYLNILCVFFASGLWHGAAWHFVVWGLINGVFQIIGDVTKRLRAYCRKVLSVRDDTAGFRCFQRVITFGLITVCWVFFRSGSTRESINILHRIVGTRAVNVWLLIAGGIYEMGLNQLQVHALIIGILIMAVIDHHQNRHGDWIRGVLRQNVGTQMIISLLLALAVLVFGQYGSGFDAASFIYTQF